MRKTIAALVLCAAAAPASALSLGDGMRGNPLNDRSFEIIAGSAGAAHQYWCGASTYARRALGADWSDRIYVLRGRGPSETTGRRTAVQFTLDQVAKTGRSSLLLNRFDPGDSLTVTVANTYCQIRTVEP